jgi:mscS family small conductance mechanosenstive ion channel
MDATKKEIIEKIDIIEKFMDELKALAPKIVLALIIFLIGYIIARETKNIFKKVMKKKGADITIVSFFSQVLFSAIIMGFVIVALGELGMRSSSFVTIIGAIGVAIGLALQNNLSNFASGIIILMFKPFKSGDFIEMQGGVTGTVYNINAMNTSLDTVDNKRIYVPNSLLTSSYVVNYSQNSERIMVINIKITYESDHNLAMKLIREILKESEYVKNNKPILCEISDLNIQCVNIISKSSIDTNDYLPAYYQAMKSIKDEFDKQNIKFAYSNNIATISNS